MNAPFVSVDRDQKREAIREIIEILDRVCDGQPVSLTAGKLRYLTDVLLDCRNSC